MTGYFPHDVFIFTKLNYLGASFSLLSYSSTSFLLSSRLLYFASSFDMLPILLFFGDANGD